MASTTLRGTELERPQLIMNHENVSSSLPLTLLLFFWCRVLDLALGACQTCALQTSFKLAEGGQWLIFMIMK